MNRIFLVIFSYIFFLFTLLYCQEVDKDYFRPENIIRFAERLFEEGDYLRAAGEFERYLYSFNSFPENSDLILFKIGICYKKSKEYLKSIIFFKKLIDLFPQSCFLSDALYEIAHNYFMIGDYKSSIMVCDYYAPNIKSGEKKLKIKQLKILNYIYQKKWYDAQKELDVLKKEFWPNFSYLFFDEAIRKGENLPIKNKNIAGIMSSVIPGLGKIYANRKIDGVISFFTVLSTGWLSYEAFKKEGNKSIRGWIYGTMSVFFYLGNIYGSIAAVNIYNKEIEGKYFKQLEVTLNVSF